MRSSTSRKNQVCVWGGGAGRRWSLTQTPASTHLRLVETAADTSAVLVPEARSPGDELSTGVSTPVHSTLICAFMHDILFISLLEQSETLVYIKKNVIRIKTNVQCCVSNVGPDERCLRYLHTAVWGVSTGAAVVLCVGLW